MADEVVIFQRRQPIPRALTERDVDSWMEAASQRTPPAEAHKTILRRWLRARNVRKYDRLQRLMRWAEEELAQGKGILPEDARWILP